MVLTSRSGKVPQGQGLEARLAWLEAGAWSRFCKVGAMEGTHSSGHGMGTEDVRGTAEPFPVLSCLLKRSNWTPFFDDSSCHLLARCGPAGYPNTTCMTSCVLSSSSFVCSGPVMTQSLSGGLFCNQWSLRNRLHRKISNDTFQDMPALF